MLRVKRDPFLHLITVKTPSTIQLMTNLMTSDVAENIKTWKYLIFFNQEMQAITYSVMTNRIFDTLDIN